MVTWRTIDAEPPQGEAGFTLVEVIVAFAILALALGVLMFIISDGIQRSAQAELAAEAASLAQSLLAQAAAETPLRSGERAGQFDDRRRWRLRTEPYAGAGDPQGAIGAYRVTAEVFWHDDTRERSLALSTLRLGPREPPR